MGIDVFSGLAASWQGLFAGCLASHALCDAFQGRFSGAKRRLLRDGSPKASMFDWLPGLGAHAGLHGLGVALVLGSPGLGAAEALSHAAIDFCKCEGLIGSALDQALHVACKAAWAALAIHGHAP